MAPLIKKVSGAKVFSCKPSWSRGYAGAKADGNSAQEDKQRRAHLGGGGRYPLSSPRKFRIASVRFDQAGSCFVTRWFLLSSATNWAFGIREASRRPS